MSEDNGIFMLIVEGPPSLTAARIKEWKKVKEGYPSTILLFRLEDDYFIMEDEAIYVHQITGRPLLFCKGIEVVQIPLGDMDMLLSILVKCGNQVGVCDQIDNPKELLFT